MVSLVEQYQALPSLANESKCVRLGFALACQSIHDKKKWFELLTELEVVVEAAKKEGVL